MTRPRLIVICGLPGSGKTTLAMQLQRELRGIRLSPDDWMTALKLDLWDQQTRAVIEETQRGLARDLLSLGVNVIVEFGSWMKAERDELRAIAEETGAAYELRYLDVALEELERRIAQRRRENPPITMANLQEWVERIEVPTPDEPGLFHPPADT